jgi:chromate reductase
VKSFFNVFAICGSTREQSSNLQLIHAVSRLTADDMKIDLYEDISLLPHFNPDLDKEMAPQAVEQFRHRIQEADGILICTPEYVFSLPGSLKNALEWTISTTLFAAKPTAIITASALGENAHASLRLIMKTMDARMTEETQLHIPGIRPKIDAAGNVIDHATAEKISQLATAFRELMVV